MTVKELCAAIEATPILMAEPDREVRGAYVGDLLSWVMGRADEDNVWVTIMSNLNVIAVASLASVSCVVLSEGVALDEDAMKRAEQEGTNILSSNLTSYEICAKLSSLI